MKSDTFYSPAEIRAELRDDVRLPQMTTIESRMAVAWLQDNMDAWERIGFNVRIGDVVSVPADFMPQIARALQESSQKRVDIVATRGNEAAIIEVKVRAPMGALGQVLGYATIWQAEHPETQRLQRIVVAGDAMLDVDAVLQAYGVAVVLYRDLWLSLGSPSE